MNSKSRKQGRGKKSAGVKHEEGSVKTANSVTTSETRNVNDEYDEIEVGTRLLRRVCKPLIFVASLTRDHGMLDLESVNDCLGQADVLFSV